MRRLGLALALVVVPGGLWGGARPATDDATIVHVLNRLTWGPRPGDLDAVRAMGLERWLDRQLHPDRIDDGAAEKRLATLETARPVERRAARRATSCRAKPGARSRSGARRSDESASETDHEAGAARALAGVRAADAGHARARSSTSCRQAKLAARRLQPSASSDEVLVDFWMNHFNVSPARGRTGSCVAEYERDAIRPHAWGRFEDLLLATAQSPAMLFYLDNWLSRIRRGRPRDDGERTRRLRRGRA